MTNSIHKNIFSILFISIIVLSIALRFFQLDVNPPSLDWDEASIGYNAHSILKTGKDEYGNSFPLSFRSFDDYKPPVYIYLTVPSIALFGLNEFAIRFPAAVIGVLMVIAVYYFVLEIFEKWDLKKRRVLAVLSTFLVAVSPWHLQFSRAAFEGNVGLAFLIISLLFLFKGFKNSKYFLLFSLFFVLSLYSYHSFRLINPLILLVSILFFYKSLIKNKFLFGISLLLIGVLSFPVYQSFLVSTGTEARLSMVTVFQDPELQKQSAEKILEAKTNNDLLGQIINNRRIFFIPTIMKGYFDHFNPNFLFIHGDGGVQHHAYNMGMVYLFELPFILIGIFYLFRKNDKRILLLLLVFFIAPLPSSVTTGTPHPVRAIAMIPAIHIFSSVGLIISFLYFSKKEKLKKVFIISSAFLFVINFFYYSYSYYILTPIEYGYFWQYGNKEAVLFAKKNENKYEKIIMTYEYDQPYIYFLLHNKIDPGWYQNNWDYSGTGRVDRFYRKIGKYEFTRIEEKHLKTEKALLIGTIREIPDGVGIVKKEIYFPDGRLAYKIVEL